MPDRSTLAAGRPWKDNEVLRIPMAALCLHDEGQQHIRFFLVQCTRESYDALDHVDYVRDELESQGYHPVALLDRSEPAWASLKIPGNPLDIGVIVVDIPEDAPKSPIAGFRIPEFDGLSDEELREREVRLRRIQDPDTRLWKNEAGEAMVSMHIDSMRVRRAIGVTICNPNGIARATFTDEPDDAPESEQQKENHA